MAAVADAYRTLAAFIERPERAGAHPGVAIEAALKAIAALNDAHVAALASEALLERGRLAPDADGAGVANVLFRRARALLTLREDDRALALLQDLHERRPGFGPAAQWLAFAHLENDPAQALIALEKTPHAAFRGDPRFAALKAEALIALDRTADAEGALDEADDHARNQDLILCRANARGDASAKMAQLNLMFAIRLLPTVALDGDRLALDRLHSVRPAPSSGRRVSVVVTTFNSAAHVAVSIGSLLEQSYDDLEIVVVDDASTDGTVDAVEAMAQPGRTLKIVRQARNGGTYAARNAGIAQATGAFVLFQDSDDWAHPAKIARSVSLLEKTGAQASTSGWARLDEHGRFLMKNPGAYVYRNASTFIRRDALERVGAFQNVRVSADSEHYHRLLNRFGPDAVLADPAVLTLGQASSGSLTGGGPAALTRLGGSLPRAAYNGRWIDAQVASGRSRDAWADLARADLGAGIAGVATGSAEVGAAMTLARLMQADGLERLKAFSRDPRRLERRVGELQARLLAPESA